MSKSVVSKGGGGAGRKAKADKLATVPLSSYNAAEVKSADFLSYEMQNNEMPNADNLDRWKEAARGAVERLPEHPMKKGRQADLRAVERASTPKTVQTALYRLATNLGVEPARLGRGATMARPNNWYSKPRRK